MSAAPDDRPRDNAAGGHRLTSREAALVALRGQLLASVACLMQVQVGWAFTTPFASQGLLSAQIGHPSLEFATLFNASAGEQKATFPEISFGWRLAKPLEVDETAPFVYNAQSNQPARYGFGSSETAIVWRMLRGSNGGRPSIGIAPELDSPSTVAGHHIGSTHWAGYLPVIVTESLGPWTAYANVARDVNPGASSRSYWFYGTVLTRRITSLLSLGAEVFHQGSSSPGSSPTDAFNIGGRLDLARSQSLYFAAGRGLRYANATDRLTLFLGYQRLL